MIPSPDLETVRCLITGLLLRRLPVPASRFYAWAEEGGQDRLRVVVRDWLRAQVEGCTVPKTEVP